MVHLVANSSAGPVLLLLLLLAFALPSSSAAAGAAVLLEDEFVVASGDRAMAGATGGVAAAANPKNWLTGAACGILHLHARQLRTVSITLDITYGRREKRMNFILRVNVCRVV